VPLIGSAPSARPMQCIAIMVSWQHRRSQGLWSVVRGVRHVAREDPRTVLMKAASHQSSRQQPNMP
jgi:hypothetical protein